MRRWAGNGSALLATALAVACTLPPLRGRMEVGRDAYAAVAADGAGGGDLYVIRADNGESVPVTFSALREEAPVLAPDGGSVAFLRVDDRDSSATAWVMNLLSGAERQLTLPEGAALRDGATFAWSADGSAVLVRAAGAMWRWAMPPQGAGEPANDADAYRVLLGPPGTAEAVPCGPDGGICVETPAGLRQQVSAAGRSPVRWGADSMAWLRGNAIEVRPLGPGVARIIEPRPARANVRGLSVYRP